MFVESFKGIKDLYEELNCLLLAQRFVFLEILRKVPFVAIFKDEIKVVGCLFDIVQLDDIFIITCF